MIKDGINYFQFLKFDIGLVMAIIAINMTVIGLTSLADKKTVIGVDYGEFLIKKFKFMKIRMYYWLILFALINMISLFIMFINIPQLQIINSIILVFSLIFAIVYFFGFILVENKLVIKQIYNEELLGLYIDSSDTNHFYVDTMVKMSSGTTTDKKLSTNVINYFSTYNCDTENAFKDAFGANSIIYSEKKINITPYKYRTSPENSYIKDISFEFFQLFRFVEHQSKWALNILLIINGDYKKYDKYDIYRLYNFARLTAQIKTFGITEDLFKYKFLFHYKNYWYSTVDKEKYNESQDFEVINEIKKIEKEIINSLFLYISKSIKIYKNNDFIELVETILKQIIEDGKYKGFLSIQELFKEICNVSIRDECDELQEIIEKNVSKYKSTNKSDILDVYKLIIDIDDIYKEVNAEKVEKINLFNRKKVEV